MVQKSRNVKEYYRPISSNLFITSLVTSGSYPLGYSVMTSSYNLSRISSFTGWLIRFTSDCLYKYIIMIPEISQGIRLTFSNIRTATDGEPVSAVSVSPVSAARASHSLPTQYENDNHFHASERSERCLLIMIRNKAAWHGMARQKKKRAEGERVGFPYPMGG